MVDEGSSEKLNDSPESPGYEPLKSRVRIWAAKLQPEGIEQRAGEKRSFEEPNSPVLQKSELRALGKCAVDNAGVRVAVLRQSYFCFLTQWQCQGYLISYK